VSVEKAGKRRTILNKNTSMPQSLLPGANDGGEQLQVDLRLSHDVIAENMHTPKTIATALPAE
jgi:hypothetical protein